MRIVVALGGNALLRRGDPMTSEIQRKNVAIAAEAIAPLALEHDIAWYSVPTQEAARRLDVVPSGWWCSASRLSCRPRSGWTRPSSCTASATRRPGRRPRWSSRRPGPERI